jgi:hypothetical protein
VGSDDGGAVGARGTQPVGASSRPHRERRAPERLGEWAVHAGLSESIAGDVPACAFAALASEPTSYQDAIRRPEAAQWQQAMQEELASLHGHGAFELVPRPHSVRVIPCRWVFTAKRDEHGNVMRFKARLVAKGFLQRQSIDYDEVFAPVSRQSTLWALLAVVVARHLALHQLDVKTAFLNGELDELVYMDQPPGYQQGGQDTVCLLRRSLYGLKQALRRWHQRLTQQLESQGFRPGAADPSLFIRRPTSSASKPVYLLVWVDDMLLAGQPADVEAVKVGLAAAFDVHDLGEARHFLGMQVVRDAAARTITIRQPQHVSDLLARLDMDGAKPRAVPLSPSIKLTAAEGQPLDTHQHP